MIDSLTGKLLIASSLVTDPMYAGGVCLVVHQDENEVIGVMLNRPLRPTPEALATMQGEDPENPSENPTPEAPTNQRLRSTDVPVGPNPWGMLHFGGPLSGPVVAIHPRSELGDVETGQGIFVAAQKQHLEHLVREQEGQCRLIVGHLGWETEQLQSEIEQGIWHIVPATVETVFSPAQEMWPRIIRHATSCSLARWIGVKHFSPIPEIN